MKFEEFKTICELNGLRIDEAESILLQRYVDLLIEWNKKINLISRKEKDIWGNHILHSISPLFKLEIELNSLILDLGTGGGLPGIPWAILKRDSRFVLLDGTFKKVKAVSNILGNLSLENAIAIWGRAEKVSKLNDYKERFDYVVCRSVGNLKEIVRWSVEFLKPENFSKKFLDKTIDKHYLGSGSLIAFKGGDVEKEISEAIKTSFISEVEVMNLDFLGVEKTSLKDKKIVLLKLRTKKV